MPELAVFFTLIVEAIADTKNLIRFWFPKNIGSSEAHGESPQPYQIYTSKKGVKLMDKNPRIGGDVNKMALLHPKALGAS